MSNQITKSAPIWKTPLLFTAALIMLLCMVRLGFWQLDRAEQKQLIVDQLKSRAQHSAMPFDTLVQLESVDQLRFRKVLLSGHYLVGKDMFVDNKVVNGQVGYQVFTPFQLRESGQVMLVARGWVSVGESRSVLPTVSTSGNYVTLAGRLNEAPKKPPLWDEKYSVSDGSVWQYLPIAEVESVLESQVFPLVVELAPDASEHSTFENSIFENSIFENSTFEHSALVRKWSQVDDQWVGKHQGYAFQWFAMAVAFFIACLVLVLRSSRKK